MDPAKRAISFFEHVEHTVVPGISNPEYKDSQWRAEALVTEAQLLNLKACLHETDRRSATFWFQWTVKAEIVSQEVFFRAGQKRQILVKISFNERCAPREVFAFVEFMREQIKLAGD